MLVDEDLLTLTNLMRNKALDNLPRKRFSPHETPAWDDRLKRAQRKANDAHKKWRSAGRPRSDDNPLRILYKAAKGQFRAQLRLHRKEQREEFFASLNLHCSDSRKLFRDIRRANGHTTEPVKYLSFDGTSYTGDNILAGWATHFGKLATPSVNANFDSTFQSQIHREIQQLDEQSPGEHIFLTVDQVEQAVKSLPTHKAAGPDGIVAEHLLYAGPLLLVHLCSIFNAILANLSYPTFILGRLCHSNSQGSQ